MVALISQHRIVCDPNFEYTMSDSNFVSETINLFDTTGQKLSTCYLRRASPRTVAQKAKALHSLPVKG